MCAEVGKLHFGLTQLRCSHCVGNHLMLSVAAAQAGHALAAAAEGVTLHHVALFLALWLPGAYVALDSEGLAALTPWRVLRVRYTHPTSL